MLLHTIFDQTTQTSYVVGRSGRRYTPAEYDAARANSGDPHARALLADVDHTEAWGDLNEADRHARMTHDCPECQAARARGEPAAVMTGAAQRARAQAWFDGLSPQDQARVARELEASFGPAPARRPGAAPRRPRWRTLKRRAG